jgi:heat shock protein HslJ
MFKNRWFKFGIGFAMILAGAAIALGGRGADVATGHGGDLAGTDWRVFPPAEERGPHYRPALLYFGERGLTWYDGCNWYWGVSYDVEGPRIALKNRGEGYMGTLMWCPPTEEAAALNRGIGAVESFSVDGDVLTLRDASGDDTVDEPRTTAQFDDGTIRGETYCGSYTATYHVEGESMTIDPPAFEGVEQCDPAMVTKNRLFSEELTKTRSFSISGYSLTLLGQSGRVTVDFSTEPE